MLLFLEQNQPFKKYQSKPFSWIYLWQKIIVMIIMWLHSFIIYFWNLRAISGFSFLQVSLTEARPQSLVGETLGVSSSDISGKMHPHATKICPPNVQMPDASALLCVPNLYYYYLHSLLIRGYPDNSKSMQLCPTLQTG